MTELPPYAGVLGLSAQTDGEGRAVLVMPFADAVVGRPGYLHGGAIAELLELAAGLALPREVAGGAEPVTATVDFIRGGRDGDTRAAGRVVRRGARVATVEAAAWQDDPDRPIATGRFTFALAPAG